MCHPVSLPALIIWPNGFFTKSLLQFPTTPDYAIHIGGFRPQVMPQVRQVPANVRSMAQGMLKGKLLLGEFLEQVCIRWPFVLQVLREGAPL
jgi:hypothetical protein